MNVISWPAPDTEVPSPDYTVEVDGSPIFVYQARVRADNDLPYGQWFGKPISSAERASFAIFDVAGSVTITVRPTRPFSKAAVLPDRFGIVPEIANSSLSFTLDQPQHLTVLLDGSSEQSLHLFIGEPETDVPNPDDPNVIYFGPGLHEIDTIQVKDGQTVYLAGGSVVKGKILLPGEESRYNARGIYIVHTLPMLSVDNASGVRICGRGILDGSQIPHPYPDKIPAVHIDDAKDILVEGITLLESPDNVIIDHSHNVQVNDVRILCGRSLGKGIQNSNSQDIQVLRCFVRNYSNSLAVTASSMPAENILFEDCTVWSDSWIALNISGGSRDPIEWVTFRRCNVIYAIRSCLGMYEKLDGTISKIVFEDIDIADLSYPPALAGPYAGRSTHPDLLYFRIVYEDWGPDPGHITDVLIDGVTLHGKTVMPSELIGCDDDHPIEKLTIRNVILNGFTVSPDEVSLNIARNQFIKELSLEAPAS